MQIKPHARKDRACGLIEWPRRKGRYVKLVTVTRSAPATPSIVLRGDSNAPPHARECRVCGGCAGSQRYVEKQSDMVNTELRLTECPC